MGDKRVQRRLMAVLVADVVGYSRLMGAAEEATLERLKSHRRELIDPKLGEHGGRLVKTTGDGMLVEFSSAVQALRCAVEIQREMLDRNVSVPAERRIQFRIGINVGDIILDGGDIFGDGVNVAARLEQLAEPGGICVSSRVQEDAAGRIDIVFEDAGEQQLKNIALARRVFRVRLSTDDADPPPAPVPALPDKPSIAVLPFQNMSGDVEQDYFADGVVEEIITALSRTRWLFVIARNSSFTYKGRSVDIKQVGRELGVRYVLEGSVRKAADRVRITGQLIDAATGIHLWADRFDGSLSDLFDLQDQLTTSVVGAVAPKLELAEIERARRKPTDSLDAYDYYLHGIANAHQFTREASSRALPLFERAIELDPNFAAPYGGAVRCYAQRHANGWMVEAGHENAEALRFARRAVAVGKDDAGTLAWAALGLALIGHELEDADAVVEQALTLNPNLAAVWHVGAIVKLWLGEPEVALEREARAMRFSPLDPLIGQMRTTTAWAHFFAGRYEDASSWAERAIRGTPSWVPAYIVGTASHAAAGRIDAATGMAVKLRQLNPGFLISQRGNMSPLRRAEDVGRLTEALRTAGLPEQAG